MQARTRGILPWLALAVCASLLSAVVPVGEALWSKVLTISGEVSIRPSEPPPDDGGGEGCSPGYWGNHKENWPDDFSAHHKVGEILWPDAPPELTLLEALEQGGGGMSALLRQTVAALLNSTHPDIDYAYDTAEVISLFQGAIADGNPETIKNLFEKANEQGCPLPKDDDGDGDDDGDHDNDDGEPCGDEGAGLGDLDDGQAEGVEDLSGDRKEDNDCDPEEDDEGNEDDGDEPCREEGQESIGSPGQGEDGQGEDTGDCEQPDENDDGESRVEATATLEPAPSLTPTPTDTPTPEPTLASTEIPPEDTEDSGD